jgi:prepilin-type N-terminal cleavage/methylation domain-containing protein
MAGRDDMTRPDPREAGFTIVEVLVAIVLLAIGAMTVYGLLGSAAKNTQRAKATQVAIDKAQEELESLRSLTNRELAMTATAAHSENSLNPGYRANSGNATYALLREPVSSYQKMVVNGGSLYGGGEVEGGVVNPGPIPFTSGDVSGDVYRYVVWRNDESCPEEVCPGTQDFKQIIVAVKLNTPGNQAGERGYVEVQSNFVDPTDSSEDDPEPGENGVVTAQQFFLTDTVCASSGATSRSEITADHLLHNTLATCADGLHTGSTKGAPDALLLGAPPDPSPEDASDPPLYDYANDFYLEPTPDTDRGLQIRRDDTSGCHYVPTGTVNPESQVHRWVTDPMAAAFTMTGNVTLEIYTRTLNDALYTGTLCVYLFKRHEAGSPLVATDTLLTNKSGGAGYWTYTPQGNGFWPRNAWTKVRLTMSFNESPYTIPAGDRLGMALGVERSNTPADAIPVMYDHPNYSSRIEVDTNTPIDGG